VRGPDAAGPADADDDAPTVPALAPLPPDPLGIPGLDYLPRPEPDVPADAGAHRRVPPRRPWPWLAGLVALAVLAALGVAWTIGSLTDTGPRRPPPAAAPPTEPVAPTLPQATGLPLPTAPDPTTPPLPSPSPSVTIPPAPSATTVAPPRPTPRSRLVRVPGVVGERRGTAERTLRAAGFAVFVRSVPAPSARQVRRVVGQLPGAGQLAPRGSAVILLVGDR
jgi:hypothetical protein